MARAILTKDVKQGSRTDLSGTSQQSSEVSAEYIRRARFVLRHNEALAQSVMNGVDVRQVILAENINRRHLTKGQRAMAVAMMYPEPEKGGRGKNSKVTLEFSSQLLSQARTVLAHSRPLADSVFVGEPPDVA
ncbi:hypothetical protein ACCS51_25940 [Rhizobium ruizarguesonis]